MTTAVLNRETRNCWDYIKDSSNETKLMLITLLSSSMAGQEVLAGKAQPVRASRQSRMSDEQMEQEMQGEPIPIAEDSEADIAGIVSANRGRIIKGLEKWL